MSANAPDEVEGASDEAIGDTLKSVPFDSPQSPAKLALERDLALAQQQQRHSRLVKQVINPVSRWVSGARLRGCSWSDTGVLPSRPHPTLWLTW
jgi:hypothetical protein